MLRDVYPYFIFDGNAAEAIEFYVDVFKAKKLDTTYMRDLPEDPEFHLPEEAKDLIVNGGIELPNSGIFMFADNLPGMPFVIGNQSSTALIYDDQEDARAAYNRLSENGQIIMELQETSWSPLYGNVKDKFGNQWQINTEFKTE